MSETTTTSSTMNFPISCTPVDLTRNPNIPELSRMLREASSMTDPARMMRHFGPWISKRSPRSALVSVSRRDLPEGSYKFTRVVLGDPSTFTNDDERQIQDPWADWHSLDTFSGGLVWELIRTPEPKLINHARFDQDEALRAIMGENASKLGSVAVIPAYDNGEAINWALIFQKEPDWGDLDMFEAGFLDLNMLGTATRNLVSRRTVERLNAQLEDQFKQVGRIQRALIPDSNPTLEGYSLASSYEPSTQAGGDFYDYFQFPDGRLGLMIADVSGHGAGAATVMAMIAAALRSYALHHGDSDKAADPAGVAKFVNEILVSSALPQMFVTAFICVLDPRTGTIDWVRCGHNPPRIRGVDGSIRSLRPPGTLPLGIDPDLTVPASTSMLAPGETLVLYTDGITETKRAGSTHDLFGDERLDEALSRCSGEPECVIETITDAVREFSGSEARDDDQTIVVVRNNP